MVPRLVGRERPGQGRGVVAVTEWARAIVAHVRCTVRLSAQQDLLLGNIDGNDRSAVDSLLCEYGIPRPETLPMVRKWSMACPAIPTCGLALTESERTLPGIVAQLERVLDGLGLVEEPISVRMTGCPNELRLDHTRARSVWSAVAGRSTRSMLVGTPLVGG